MTRDPKPTKRSASMQIQAIAFPSARDAIRHAKAAGGTAIRLNGRRALGRFATDPQGPTALRKFDPIDRSGTV